MNTKELEDFAKSVFGESAAKLEGFRQEQIDKIEKKIGEMAKRAVADELGVLRTQLETLEHRVATLEKRLER